MEDLSTNLLLFLAFSVIAVFVYKLTKEEYKKYILLSINIIFYYFCSAKFLAIMIFSGLWSFIVALNMSNSDNPKNRLLLGILPLVGVLCIFKYWNPLVSILPCEWNGVASLLLPIGMSYYILKSISYLFDVYYLKIDPERDVFSYLAYITFFAQIIAGPIQRYEEWKKQIQTNRTVGFKTGYYFIVSGLFMKVVIANRMANYVTSVFDAPSSMSGLQLWMVFFLYAFYILFDFAGYSNIAIGVTQCFGIDCIKNFKRPYLAYNIKDFWGRWHISLSTWLRDYVYIPLGGNRNGKNKKYINIIFTFLVSGMWHGSTWNFIVWGGYHGILNILLGGKIVKDYSLKYFGRVLLTFLFVCVGWVFFATKSFEDAVGYLEGMIMRLSINMDNIQSAILPFTNDNTCLSYFLVLLIFLMAQAIKDLNDEYGFIKKNKIISFIWQVFILSSIILFGVFNNTSFIYAGF